MLTGLVAAALSAAGATAAQADEPRVEMSPDGTAHVGWLGTGGTVDQRVWTPAGALLDADRLSAAGDGSFATDLGLDASGDAYRAWHRPDAIRGRRLSARGAAGPVETLSGPAGGTYEPPRVAVDRDGDALVVWSRERPEGFSVIEARRSSPAGALGPLLTLSRTDESGYEPDVAIDGDGDAIVVWRSSTLDERELVVARTVGADGVPGELRTVSSGTAGVSGPRVEVAADGDAIMVWSRDTARGVTPHLKERSSTGRYSATFPLKTYAGDAYRPHLAVAPDGSAIVTWGRAVQDGGVVVARHRSAEGRLGPLRTITEDPAVGSPSGVAMGGDGSALIVWERFGEEGTTVIQARRRLASGAYGPIQDVTPPGRVKDPAVALDDDGNGAIVWERSAAPDLLVEGRRRSSSGRLGEIVRLSE